MDEAFDMWTTRRCATTTPACFPEWWETDIDAMVRKDRNHPERRPLLDR